MYFCENIELMELLTCQIQSILSYKLMRISIVKDQFSAECGKLTKIELYLDSTTRNIYGWRVE